MLYRCAKRFSPNNIPLETQNGIYYFLKADIFNGIFLYTHQGDAPSSQIYSSGFAG